MTLEGTKENIGTLLWTELSSRKLDTRIGTDEIELRGELLLFVCTSRWMEKQNGWNRPFLMKAG